MSLMHIHPHLGGMHRTHGIRHRALRVLVHPANGADGHLEIPQVVHRIENTKHVHAVDRAALDERGYHVIGVVPIAEDVLCPEQHLLPGVWNGTLQRPQALPWILAEVADAGVEGRSAPGLERPKTHFVQLFGDGQHVVDPHTCRQQGLVSVAQHQFGNT